MGSKEATHSRDSFIRLLEMTYIITLQHLDGRANDLVVVIAVERQLAAQQQEQNDAHRPQIRLHAISAT